MATQENADVPVNSEAPVDTPVAPEAAERDASVEALRSTTHNAVVHDPNHAWHRSSDRDPEHLQPRN